MFTLKKESSTLYNVHRERLNKFTMQCKACGKALIYNGEPPGHMCWHCQQLIPKHGLIYVKERIEYHVTA